MVANLCFRSWLITTESEGIFPLTFFLTPAMGMIFYCAFESVGTFQKESLDESYAVCDNESTATGKGTQMKLRDKINLINRAIAAMENPKDLTREEISYLIEDLDSLGNVYRQEQLEKN